MVAQYLQYPVLFGGNVGPGYFDALSDGFIVNGKLTNTSNDGILCMINQLAAQNVPSRLSGLLKLPAEVVTWATGKLNLTGGTFASTLRRCHDDRQRMC